MKCYVILFTLLVSLPLMASDRQLLKCLGEEEKQFHKKKVTGPIFDLNQRLISELVQIPRVEISPENYKLICSDGHASLNLLYQSLINGKNLFGLAANLAGTQKQMTEGMIDDYLDSTKEIFLNLISQVQTLAPTPTCLKEEIPELDSFFTDIKYLQEDVDIKNIFQGRDRPIFEKLKKYQVLFNRCKSRVKIKKNPKSESTAPSKKS